MSFQAPTGPPSPVITKGVAYLRSELPKSRNADAVRAMLEASARGYDVGASLDDTLLFLKQPSQWDTAPGAGDKALAHVQFASALAAAELRGKAASTDLMEAAKVLIADQNADGSWTLDQPGTVASAAAYGTILATWLARSALISSGKQPDDFPIVQADRWIRGLAAESVLEASAILLALELSGDVMAENLRRTALGIVRTGQAAGGGWGATADAAPQVFDTALAVLALSALNVEPRIARSTYRPEELLEAIAKGKAYIESQQRPDGSWTETTRPAGPENSAQRISTTGWALLAVLAR
ncbi:MAG: prenyltransferase/squalene oxidase repeat-containing protein [Vicinamibacterales bacterium]|jgi:squalene cyclase